MPSLQFSNHHEVPEPIRPGLERLITQLKVRTQFPEDVVDAAVTASQHPDLPTADRTDIDFVTIDPEGSMDLDQAVHIVRKGGGFTVYYAIADVAAWVKPGGAIDQECQLRGQTFYAPHTRFALHPPVLSEDAASLLPEGDPRPAMAWTLELDQAGELTSTHVERALVRSRRRYSYVEVQRLLDEGNAPEVFELLKEVGLKREALEVARGGVSLPIPAQEVDVVDGQWSLVFRSPLPVEGWNAQISLLTGHAAALLMREHKVGILRTLPPVEKFALDKLRRTAQALGIVWPKKLGYPEFLRSLDRQDPRHLAMMQKCTSLFRGAGYMSFDGELPGMDHEHNALAMFYAHTTAPLRRLVDRYALVTCAALCAGQEVPAWVRTALPTLPATMDASDKRAKAFERGVNNLVEALLCKDKIGQRFDGVIVDAGEKHGARIMIAEPAIEAKITGNVELGAEVVAKLVSVDLLTGDVIFDLVREK